MLKLVKYQNGEFRFLIPFQIFLFKYSVLKDILNQPGIKIRAGGEFIMISVEDKGPSHLVKKQLWDITMTLVPEGSKFTFLETFAEALDFLKKCKKLDEGDEE